mgnify:CR=1 FL=1
MSDNKFNVTIFQDEFWALGVKVTDQETGDAVDFTGFTGELVIRSSVDAADTLIRKPVTFPSGDPDKQIEITLTATESDNLVVENKETLVNYEVKVWDPNDRDGTADIILWGLMKVLPSVSRV